MKASRLPVQLIVSLIGAALIAVAAQGQGIILPRPCPRPVPRCPTPPQVPTQPLKLKSIHISTRITDQAVVTHIEQIFDNDTPYVLEGIYFFPLPENVSITEFAMWDGDKRLAGEVRPRDEARRIYDNIVRTRRDPALLEYAGKNLFQASIFPIQPNSEKKIELTYSQILNNENGTVAYRYPLGTGWRANGFIAPPPRPIPFPGPRREVQPTRTRPDLPRAGRISADIEIASRVAIKGIYSPSHEIEVKRDGERKAKLSFETRAENLPPDFQLFYTLSDQDFGVSLLTHREPGKDGYFMLLVSPKAELNEKEVSAKEIVFVLDTSGSMSEEGKMEKAKAALRFGVNSLEAKDRFNIISFAGEEHLLSESLISADKEGKNQALGFIDKMRPIGGTNINDAVLAALRQLQSSSRPQMVILITDGQPTVGVTQHSRILNNAKEANKANVRLFTFGVGYDVNTLLLDGLANENRGAVAYIEPKEDLEIKVSNFFAKVNHPVLSDVKIDWGGVETDLVYPRTTPDIFHGSQLALVGRYRVAKRALVDSPDGQPGEPVKKFLSGFTSNRGPRAGFNTSGAHRLTLTGKVNGRERRFVYEDLNFPEKSSENDFLPHLWAMRRVGYLLEQIRLNGDSKELRDEVVELGTRYGIVTPYTSYLILEPGVQPRLGAAPSVSETVEIQASEPSVRRGDLPATGRQSVEMSKRSEKLISADKIAVERHRESSGSQIAQAGGKTFYFRDGVWTDSEFKTDSKLPVVTLKFASDDYFKLLSQEKKLAEFFALGQRVVVVWNGKVYRVEE